MSSLGFDSKRYEYDASGNLLYEGFALPGTAETASGWIIAKYTWDEHKLTGVTYAGGSAAQVSRWDLRAGYIYS